VRGKCVYMTVAGDVSVLAASGRLLRFTLTEAVHRL